jgi:hypothetical protein
MIIQNNYLPGENHDKKRKSEKDLWLIRPPILFFFRGEILFEFEINSKSCIQSYVDSQLIDKSFMVLYYSPHSSIAFL